MILFKSLKQNHINIFCKRHLWVYALIAVVSFSFVKASFTDKARAVNAAAVCSADLMCVVKENLIFLPVITAAFIFMTLKDYDFRLSYNMLLKYTKRKQAFKYQVIDIVLNSALYALFITALLCVESLVLTKNLMNWSSQNSYYAFVNGNVYSHSMLVFCLLMLAFVFSFVCTQMLIGLYFLWRNINTVYIYFILFAFVGVVMLINRLGLVLKSESYGLTIFNVLPYAAVFAIAILISLLVVMNTTVLKREFIK